MPSPFPGMDPYLEDPGLWPDVHHELISEARAALNVAVGPGYYVRVEERVYLAEEDDPAHALFIPDLRISRTQRQGEPARPAVAVAEVEPVLVTTLEDEIREARLEIRGRDDRELVTVIEVVSPSNKVRGSAARESYLEKRSEVMRSPCHWVEVDLLRAGAPFLRPELLAGCAYYAHASRAGERPKGQLWRIELPQRLPVVRIPLRPQDGHVGLDLQKVLDAAYDRAAYDKTTDYRQRPAVPLTKEQARWANRLLREKGLR